MSGIQPAPLNSTLVLGGHPCGIPATDEQLCALKKHFIEFVQRYCPHEDEETPAALAIEIKSNYDLTACWPGDPDPVKRSPIIWHYDEKEVQLVARSCPNAFHLPIRSLFESKTTLPMPSVAAECLVFILAAFPDAASAYTIKVLRIPPQLVEWLPFPELHLLPAIACLELVIWESQSGLHLAPIALDSGMQQEKGEGLNITRSITVELYRDVQDDDSSESVSLEEEHCVETMDWFRAFLWRFISPGVRQRLSTLTIVHLLKPYALQAALVALKQDPGGYAWSDTDVKRHFRHRHAPYAPTQPGMVVLEGFEFPKSPPSISNPEDHSDSLERLAGYYIRAIGTALNAKSVEYSLHNTSPSRSLAPSDRAGMAPELEPEEPDTAA